ncbi:MAG: hypothetical protein A4S09_06840 [Proteobacteria bacterium SG_bin7]|nr:MAG: hypothetical protein A4S09_06840 [Proteobacteria bacterium SG_bin7]
MKKVMMLFVLTGTFVLTMVLFASRLYAYKPTFKYAANEKHGVLVVIDVSSSMAGGPIEAVRNILAQTMSKFSKNTAAGLISFSGCTAKDIVLEVPFADNNAQAVISKANSLSIRRGTDVYGALVMAQQEVQKIGSQYCSTVLLLSDGVDTCRTGPVQEVVKKMVEQNSKCNKVSAISIGVPAWESQVFDEIAEVGKGKHTSVDTPDQLDKAVEDELSQHTEEVQSVGGWEGDHGGSGVDPKNPEKKKDPKKNVNDKDPKGPDPLVLEKEEQRKKGGGK